MIKLVIFDLDGTLVDSAPDVMEAANSVMNYFGYPLINLAAIQKSMGGGFRTFIRNVVGPKLDDPQVSEKAITLFTDTYRKCLLNKTVFFPGVTEFLRNEISGAGRKAGVVTNKTEISARLILDGLTPADFRWLDIFGCDRFEERKPHPRPLQEMMKLADVKPSETIMVGDSHFDIGAAKAADAHFVGVTFGYNSIEDLKAGGAEVFASSFAELKKIISSRFS